MMKVGIDIQATAGSRTGLGVYTQNLVEALGRIAPDSFDLVFYQKSGASRMNTPERLLWENWELPSRARKGGVGLLHVPAYAPPWRKPCKTVVTVHDLIGMRFPNQQGWPSRFYWGKWLPAAVRRADAVIACSESTKKDIEQYLGIPASKIRVIYPSGHESFGGAVDSNFLSRVKKQFGIRDHYFLCVGTLEPRKNLSRAVESFSNFRQQFPMEESFQLVLAGSQDFAHGTFHERIRKSCRLDDSEWVCTGYVDHLTLNALYAGAHGLLFPSLYEGFGIPILEAMACGCPVIASRTTSMPEVAGEAGWLVDPTDIGALTDALRCFAENDSVRRDLISKGFEQIKKFSWDRTARQTLEVYESLI